MEFKYFDHAATTKVEKEVLDEMKPYFQEQYGNPSAIYTMGKQAKNAIEESREKVAKLLGCKQNEVYFTGGGTESDNMAIKGIAYANSRYGRHIITSKIEHSAVLNTCHALERQGFKITYIDVNKDGIIDLNQLRNAIRPDTILITIMFANNEIGSIQPIYEISKIAKMHNIIFHTDAVQACGNISIDTKEMEIDGLSLSGHKIYGPKGIGALYIKEGINFNKLIDGAHQEKDKKAGTENVPGIVGLGKACELARTNLTNYKMKLEQLRDYYIKEVREKIPFAKLNGGIQNRLPGNANFSFEGVDGKKLILKLDEKGICASSGSACAAGSIKPSHVLTAIGLPKELAKGSLRISFGKDNNKEDIDYLVESLQVILKELREN